MSGLATKTLKALAAALFAASLSFCVSARASERAEKQNDARSDARPQTVSDYRTRLSGAAQSLDEFASYCEHKSRGSKAGEEPYEDSARTFEAWQKYTFGDVRGLLPPKERVMFAGREIEADNSWLHASLDEFAKLDNWDARAASLRSASE